MIWRETLLPRVAYCGRVVADNAQGVTVRVSESPEGNRAGFSGLQSCGSVWACPVCSEKINAARQAELAAGIDAWIADGGSVVLATFTVQHIKTDRLSDLWDALSPAWNRTTSGAGVAWNGGKSERGDKATYGIAGFVRLVETNHGKNGWHPHVHALLFLDAELTTDELDGLRHRMFTRWDAALGKAGLPKGPRGVIGPRRHRPLRSLEFDKDGHAVGADLRPITSAEYIADYFSKHGYRPNRTSAAGAAYEVTGSHSKQQSKGGRSPFGILADLVQHGDEQDLTLWHEWERVSAGRRQLTWSRGMRDLLGLDDELTDEELAEQEFDGDELVTFSKDEWRDGHLHLYRIELLEAAEAGTLPELLLRWRQGTPDKPPGVRVG